MAVDFEGLGPTTTDAVTGVIFFLCLVVSVANINRHFEEWRSPQIQTLYSRLILLPAIFSFTGMFTVLETHWGEYAEIIRGAFESYCLYCFFALMLVYAGGEKRIVRELEETKMAAAEGRAKLSHAGRICRLFCPPFPSGAFFIRLAKIALVQFMILKPLFGLLTAYYVNEDSEANDTGDAVLAFKILGFFSMFFAFYFLLNVYICISPRLEGLGAGTKFLLIKLIVFIIIFQGLVISSLVDRDKINAKHGFSAEKRGERIHSFLITLEMFIFSAVFWFTFSPFERHIKERNRVAATMPFKYFKLLAFYDVLYTPLEPTTAHTTEELGDL